MAKTEPELRREFDKSAQRETIAAWLIVAALLLEAIVVWRFSDNKSPVETILLIASDLAIAAGVYGEIHFGRRTSAAGSELQRISDQRVAEANARAAEAQLRLEELRRRMGPRALNTAEFLKALDGRPKAEMVQIVLVIDDQEALDLSMELHRALSMAEWRVSIPQPVGWSTIRMLTELPSTVAAGQPSGVTAVVQDQIETQYRTLMDRDADTPPNVLFKALLQGLGGASISVKTGAGVGTPPGVLLVVVGPKPAP